MAHQTDVFDLSELAWIVKSRHGIDLSRYRSTCLSRRVQHRMVMAGCNDIEEYIGRLTVDSDEMEKLMDIVTIHVTGFFRDRDVFGSLPGSRPGLERGMRNRGGSIQHGDDDRLCRKQGIPEHAY
jgi:hypothetical protein